MPNADPNNPIVQRMQKKFAELLSLMDKRLSEAPWLAGEELTIADIMTVFSLTTMRSFYQYDLSEYSNILAYLKRASQRDAYLRAKQKGDPQLDIEKLIGGPPPPMFPALAAMRAQQK